MTFKNFRQWLSDNLKNQQKFTTLKKRSYFYAYYDEESGLIKLELKTGSKGQLRDNQIEKIFERYKDGTYSEKNMTSYYYDPWWPDTPNRILAPTIPAIIKVWITQEKNSNGKKKV